MIVDLNENLCIWAVYAHPDDFPTQYVARMFVLDVPTEQVIFASTLDGIRSKLLALHPGLTCLARQPGDPPVVVETWL
jgi:hypothetical protein